MTTPSTGRDDEPPQPAARRSRRGASARPLHAPEIDWREERRGSLPGNRYVRVLRPQARTFTEITPDHYVAQAAADIPPTAPGRAVATLKHFLIGRPIPTAGADHERLSKTKALAILASDALASVAYGTEALLVILVLGGAAAFRFVMPISLAILALLALVSISYRRTIPAYPGGGSSYIVARQNLGTVAGLVAAGSLMVDYILNVAVSVSAGVLALISAAPALASYKVPLCLGTLLVVMLGNLRGVRESGTIFAAPTYFFIVSMFALIVGGIVRVVTGDAAPPLATAEAAPAAQSVGLFLILRAFANGCTALTGVEAISNGIPAFKKPETRNAAITLTWVAALLGVMFIGVSFLARQYNIAPMENESVVSQIAARVFAGRGVPYYLIQAATILILLLATNTSFADFPRLSSILARDGFLPHQFQYRGDRLAFTTGIIALTLASGVLLVVFRGETNRLIPLFALGAFLAFTFSQAGMVQHWRHTPGNHRRSLLINGAGAATTGVTALVIGVSKFTEGAWITVLIIPLLVALFLGIARHYRDVARDLRPVRGEYDPFADERGAHLVIIPVAAINKATLHALAYAHRIASRVIAVHVTDDAEAASALQREWSQWVRNADLVILESPYRSLIGPCARISTRCSASGPMS